MTKTISIIIPVKDIDDSFRQSIQSVARCSPDPHEVIIIFDGKPDQPIPETDIENIRFLQLEESKGPATARNEGARHATGEILLFVDADVILPQDLIAKIIHAFESDLNPVAVFGSYDNQPVAKDTVSQYKNLFHFYTHQNSQANAFTFWTGCGAMLRSSFFELGGFSETYTCPSIEDIELGYRAKKAGYAIFLDKSIQVTHLKQWTLLSLIKTDFCYRAIPWSRLILRYGNMTNDMNINMTNRLSVLLSGLVLFFMLCTIWSGYSFFAVLFVFASLLYINRDLFLFFYRRKGLFFTLRTIPLHYIYYVISGTAFLPVALLFYSEKLIRFLAPKKTGDRKKA